MSERNSSLEHESPRQEANRPKPPADLDDRVAKDLEAVFQRLVANAVTLTSARAGSLSLFSSAYKKLRPLIFYSQDGSQPSWWEYAAVARRVVEQRAPALISQGGTDPRLSIPPDAPPGALICVPLLAGQEALGALLVAHPRPGTFNRQHQHLLETLADVAAAALRQAQQQEMAAQQAHILATVVQLGRALSNTNDMRHVLSLTTAGIRRLIICEEAVLFSYEAPTQELRGVAGLGTQSARLAEQRIRIDDMHSVTAWVGRQRRPLLHSAGSRAFVGHITDTLLTQQDHALLAVPLVAQDQLWGVITLARPEPFDANDLRVMLNLSSFVAPALMQTNRPGEEQ